MDFSHVLSKSNPHQRTVIHLDMDYFYAQVEELRDPALRTQPLGIQQKNIVVTCNYIAREFGVTKLMLVDEAQRRCPSLVLVNGEDLTPYRQMSQRIFEVLLNYTPLVEKLGFDENFMDVTSLVEAREQQQQRMSSTLSPMTGPAGHVYPSDGSTTLRDCDCGCGGRLVAGSQIAQEIRNDLQSQLGLTCCAGISYNKLLAKLVGSQNKPNQQTVLASACTEQFMRNLGELHRVTGIGQKTESLLLESGISSVTQLQGCEMDFLRKKFGFETATKLKDLAYGRDMSAVRPTGKPKSIGLEDSCRPISMRTEVEDRFRLLLMRLMEQVAEDGRIPVALKVILRKFDAQKKTSHRETKQVNILPSLFKTSPCTDTGGSKVLLADGAQEKLLKIIMRLFERVVDLNKPFNVTLIGLAFSKFQQRKVGSSSIANFLIKKTDLEVQSITSLTNSSWGCGNGGAGISASAQSDSPTPSVSSTNSDEAFRSSPTTFQPSDQFYRRRTATASPIPMLLDNGSESGATNSDFSDFSETEVEPSPKKSRISRLLVSKRRCFGSSAVAHANETAADVASPSKLRVCDLRLNSRDSEKDFPISNTTPSTGQTPSTSGSNVSSGIPRFRTVQPPSTLLNRLEDIRNGCGLPPTSKLVPQLSSTSSTCFPLPTPMDVSFGSPTTPTSTSPTVTNAAPFEPETPAVAVVTSTTTITGNLSNIPCPAGVDPGVFNELPLEVQNELIASWRNSLAAAAAAVANGTTVPTASTNTHGNAAAAKVGGGPAVNGAQKNTLYRYFLRNKAAFYQHQKN